MSWIESTFARPKAVIGMIHVGALPGTPRHHESLDVIAERAVAEAKTYADGGLDGVMIENMHDAPYLNSAVGPEIVAGMAVVAERVRQAVSLPLGVQILAAANREALAVAHAVNAQFVRVENFAYAHVADEGLMPTAEAGPLLRYRRQIGADPVRIIADVKKKHSSHALTADVTLGQAAETAAFFGADALVVTGSATGRPTSTDDLSQVREAVDLPIFVGSGVTLENLPALWPRADAYIVGSHLKRGGLWSQPVDHERVAALVRVAADLRKTRP